MPYLGSWKIDDYLTIPCNTHDPSDGSATDADAVPAYRVYEDETGTAILTGNMAKLDDANTTGFYSERIQLTAGNGLEKGKCYTIYISAAVGGVTGTMHHTFQMEAEVDANVVSDKTGYALTGDDLDRILGMLFSNHVEDDIVRDGNGNKTACNLYLYNSKANAQTHDGSTGLIGKYAMAATFDGDNRLTLYTVTKES